MIKLLCIPFHQKITKHFIKEVNTIIIILISKKPLKEGFKQKSLGNLLLEFSHDAFPFCPSTIFASLSSLAKLYQVIHFPFLICK